MPGSAMRDGFLDEGQEIRPPITKIHLGLRA